MRRSRNEKERKDCRRCTGRRGCGCGICVAVDDGVIRQLSVGAVRCPDWAGVRSVWTQPGDLLSQKALQSDPELARRIEVEAADERNVALSNAAKAKAFDQMLYIFGALMLAFVLMQIELAAILLLVAAYMFIVGCSIYYRSKYEKEM